MKLTLTLVVILALVSVSQAAIVKTIGEYSIDVTADTASPASPGLTAYIVTVKTVQGLYGADARVDALNGAYLNQEWGYDGTAPTPSADIGPGQPFRSLTQQQKDDDTHILIPSGNRVAVRSPDENLISGTHNGTWLAGAYDADGLGNNDGSQTMVFGITKLADFNNVPFARVVVASYLNAVSLQAPSSGQYVSIDMYLTEGLGDAAQFNLYLVPEPMSLSLLALGGLALLRRRNR